MAPMQQQPGSGTTMDSKTKLRWGELGEDEPPDFQFFLPPKQVTGPDENGIKVVIEYKLNDEGKNVKVTTTMRVRKARFSKGAIERRSWAKFGDAVDEDVGSRLTMVSTEEIRLERHKPLGSQAEEVEASGDALGQLAGKGGGILMVCRICGKKGDHWTSRCPVKDLAPQPETANGGAQRSSESSSSASRRNDENALRVGNLTQDAIEADLQELFSPFGPIARAYIVKDFKTGSSKGYGFVNFYNREDAQRALDKLDGYGYDNLILDVAWSKPK